MIEPVARRGGLRVYDVGGLYRLTPRPDPRKIEAHYRNEYGVSDEWFTKERDEHEAGLWDSRYFFERKLLGTGWLLDYGAGVGEFVKWWNDGAGVGLGIEPSRKDRERMIPSRLYRDTDKFLAEHRLGETVVNGRARLVLEHVPDSVEFLKDMRRACNGKILIEVPNEFNPLQNRLRRKYGDWFIDPWHLNYFTPESLTQVIEDAGLKVTWMGATFPIEIFCWLGLNYLDDPAKGAKAHYLRLRFEKAAGPLAFRFYKLLFDRLGWGREIIVVCE